MGDDEKLVIEVMNPDADFEKGRVSFDFKLISDSDVAMGRLMVTFKMDAVAEGFMAKVARPFR